MIVTNPKDAAPNRWLRLALDIAVDGTEKNDTIIFEENIDVIGVDVSIFALNTGTEIMQPLDRVSLKLEIVGGVSPTQNTFVPVKALTGAPGMPSHMSIPMKRGEKLKVTGMHEGNAGTAMKCLITFKGQKH